MVRLALGAGVRDGHCDGPLVCVLAATALQTAAGRGELLAACVCKWEGQLACMTIWASQKRGRAHRKLPADVHALDLKALPAALGRPRDGERVAQGECCHAPKRVRVLIEHAIPAGPLQLWAQTQGA